MITFSIIVPAYNIEAFIDDCVKSVLGQTEVDYELILVDDGSTDDSGWICDRYHEEYPDKIRVIHKANGGLSDARNAGVAEASGEYIVFLDGDDSISDTTIAMMSEVTPEKPDVILSECMYRMSETGEVYDNRKYRYDRSMFRNISGREALLITSSKRVNWTACGKAYRREFWTEHGYEFKMSRSSEDMQLIDHVVIDADKVCMVPGFYYYRNRTGSITRSMSPKDIMGILLNIDEWNDYLAAAPLDDQLIANLRNLHALTYCGAVMGYISTTPAEKRDDLIREAEAREYILKYGLDKGIRLVRKSISMLGYKNTCGLISLSKRIRRF